MAPGSLEAGGMMFVDFIGVVATLGFVGLLVGTTVLAGRGLGLEQRAGLLERRDPATAEALRRAQSITGFGGGAFGDEGYYSTVCTPSRRSGLDLARVRGTDPDLRVEAAEEALPPMPATVVVLGRSEHVPRTLRAGHANRRSQPVETVKSPGHQPTASG
ncbi:hypothetical protein [Agromyces laixinhei]|uniref:hypothetical protein n=1 Tax=Agromyces laixinhei TaxID=2585717 RepID=UPI001116FF90|nr:hypothetical protein [Agromyces laixinhei]